MFLGIIVISGGFPKHPFSLNSNLALITLKIVVLPENEDNYFSPSYSLILVDRVNSLNIDVDNPFGKSTTILNESLTYE